MKIVIIGAGSTAMHVADIVFENRHFSLSGFVGTPEEKETIGNSDVYGNLPFLGDHSVLPKLKDGDIHGFIVAIGDVRTREAAFYEGQQAGLVPVNAISDKAIINPTAIVDRGVVVSPGAILTHGAKIGSNIILSPGVIVNVNASVGDHCYLHTGSIIGSECIIERGVTFGAGAIAEPTVKIGKNNTVAAGTVVHEDIEGLYREEDA